MMQHEFEKRIRTTISSEFYNKIEEIYMTYEFLDKRDMEIIYKYHSKELNLALRHFEEKKKLPECQAVKIAERYIGKQLKSVLQK